MHRKHAKTELSSIARPASLRVFAEAADMVQEEMRMLAVTAVEDTLQTNVRAVVARRSGAP